VVLIAGPIARATTGDPGNGVYLRLVALGLPLWVFDESFRTWLRLQRRPGTTVAVASGSALIALAMAALLVGVLDLGLWGVFGSTVIAQAAMTVAALLLMRSWLNPGYFRVARARAMLVYAWPRIPGDIAYWILDLSDRFIIQHFWSEAEVAKYQMASTLAAATSLAVQAFQQAWLPSALSIRERADSAAVYARALPLYIGSVGIVAVVTAALMRHAISVAAPEVYLSATTAGGILAAAYMLRGARSVAVTGAVIGGSQVGAVGALFTGAIVNIGLNLVLVPSAGITGAAAATAASYVVALILTLHVAQRLHHIPYSYVPSAVLVVAVIAITWLRAATAAPFGLVDSALAAASIVAFVLIIVATKAVEIRSVLREVVSRWPR